MDATAYIRPSTTHSRTYVVRCVEQGDGTFLLRVIAGDTEDGREIRRETVKTFDELVAKVEDETTPLMANVECVEVTADMPAEVREALDNASRDATPIETFEAEDTAFDGADELGADEKQFLDKLYRSKLELPKVLSSTNRITSLFASAGFATAATWYDPRATAVLGVLSAVLGLSLFVAIRQLRTEITPDEHPALYEAFQEAVESVPHATEDARFYATRNILKSPFTLPFGPPSVYFPKETLSDLTKAEIQAIAEHELGHHENTALNLVTIIVSIASTLVVAPLLVAFTPLTANRWLFVTLVAYMVAVQGFVLIANRRDEETADAAVSRHVALAKALVRLSPSTYHVSTPLQGAVHRLFDVHPPMNERLESLLGAPVTVETERSWGLAIWGSMLLVFAGSFLIGVGFLTFTAEPVPESLMFYGTLLTFAGLLPYYYVSEGPKYAAAATIVVCISFAITLGIGFLSGADSVVGAVAHGKLWRQILGLGVSLVVMTVILVSTVYFDVEPSLDGVSPATDWYDNLSDDE